MRFLVLLIFVLVVIVTNAQLVQQKVDSLDFDIIDTTYVQGVPNISDFRWDTLYLRTSRHPHFMINDTEKICLRTPQFPKFKMPVPGNPISEFGWRGRRIHTGIDIKLNRGDSVYCAFDGIVRVSRYFSGYGNIVVVRHYNGIETVYAHLSKRLVGVNDTVQCGQVLGLGGRTGRATCDHLHFETRYKEQPFNPRLLIDFNAKKLNSDTLLLTEQSFKFSKKNSSKKNHAKQIAQHNKKGQAKVHVIQKGDTLFSLARRYHTTVDQICQINGIDRNDILHLGQKIMIP
ncbi:MAG: peptidoglycan DD-metalloendopeptidase family protein [Bacteroidales bacterium]|nr:peptidoglycan DD-metalloendopeptidase family protein [Bacteroidales bacterium]